MLDHLVERAREEKVFSREDTPTEDRVKAAVLYHLGLSYRTVDEWLGHSHQAVHEWYTKLADLFEPEPDSHRVIVVDETKVAVEDEEVYVWAAVDRHTFEVIHVEVSPGRPEMDALLFLRTVLERTRGANPSSSSIAGPGTTGASTSSTCNMRLGEKPGAIAHSSNRGSPSSSIAHTDSSTASRTTAPGNQLIDGRTPSP